MSTVKRIYKIQLTEMELNKLNLIENETIRQSAMSIFAYMLKLNAMENDKLDNAGCLNLKDILKLKISFRKFIEKYNRGHKDKKVSIRTFKNRVDLLEKLGLIIKEKFKNTFIYGFTRYQQVNEEVNSKVNSSDNNQTIENTEQTSNSQKHKYLNLKTYLDIDTCNNSLENKFVDNLKTNIQKITQNKKTTSELSEENNDNSFNKNYSSNKSESISYTDKEFISEGLERCSSWNDVSKLLDDAFKEFKIYSFKLKNDIINKIGKNLTNITKKFAGNYIRKAVLQVKIAEQRRRTAYAAAINCEYDSRKQDGWTNYGCEHGVEYYVEAAEKLSMH